MNKHVILSQGRSGSNYFVNILNQHSQAVNYGEMLGDWTLPHKLFLGPPLKVSPKKLINFALSNNLYFYCAQLYSALSHKKKGVKTSFSFRHNVKTIGFKEFFIHIDRLGLEDIFADYKIVYLFRENLLKRHVSLCAMSDSGKVVAMNPNEGKRSRVHLMIDQLIPSLDILNEEVQREKELLDKMQCLGVYSIKYEDYFFAEDRTETLQALYHFLEIPFIAVETEHQKILPNKLEDVVENYASLRKCLTNTPYERFLY